MTEGRTNMKSIFLFISLCLSLPICAQDIKPDEKLILSDSLVFLGIDFSAVRMINEADVDQGPYIRDKHGPYWCIIGDYMCQHTNLKFDFEKKSVACMARLQDSSYIKLPDSWIVANYAGISDTALSQHIRSYPIIEGYKVGVVFVVDKMDKKKNALTMYGVYVDLRDNSVLKAIKCVGTPNGFGYSMYWATGVDEAYLHFTPDNHNYLHRLKHYFKKK